MVVYFLLKIDFLQFPYSFVENHIVIEGVRLVTIPDIAVMKLLAISRRGSKKDFVDLYFILERMILSDIVTLFQERLPQIDMFHILKSLTYFDDAEKDANPETLQKITWAKMKKTITEKATVYLKHK